MLGPTALAAALGISRQMVYQYLREGKITRTDGQFDLETVRRQLAQNLGSKQGGSPKRGKPAPPVSYDAAPAVSARTEAGRQVLVEMEPQPHGGSLKREHAIDDADAPEGSKADLEKKLLAERVEKAKLDNSARKKILIDAADTAQVWGNAITLARNRAVLLPGELASKLAAESDVTACEEILKVGIYEMLSDLAGLQPDA